MQFTETSGALVSANQRHVGGDALATLGDGGYCAPYRARQIREETEKFANLVKVGKVTLD